MLFVTITVGAFLTVGFSHARCPSRNRTSSIRMGRSAIAKAKFLWLDQGQQRIVRIADA